MPTTAASRSSTGGPGDEVAHFDDGSGHDGVPAARTGSRTPRWSRRTPTGRSASRWPATSPSAPPAPTSRAIVQHFEVTGSSGGRVNEPGGWPQFHHDAQLTGFVGGGDPLGGCNRSGRRVERLSHRGLRRRHLRLRAGLLRQHRQPRPQQTGRRHGHGARPGRLLAGRLRRRRVLLRRTRSSTGRPAALTLNKPIVGHGGHARRQGLLARGLRRRHLHASATPPFYGSAASDARPDHRRDGGPARTAWATGRSARRAASSPSATPLFAGDTSGLHLNGFIVGMTRRPGDRRLLADRVRRRRVLLRRAVLRLDRRHRTSTSRSWRCRPPTTAAATGSSPPTAASSPTATRRSGAPWAADR